MKRKRRRTHGGLCDTKEEKGSVPRALSLVARAVRGKAGVSQQIGGQLEPGRDDGRIMGDFWREGKPRRSSQQQHRTDLAWKGPQYQQVAIGQLEGGGSTMEAHGMLSSLVVRRGKRTRALVGGEQATNERAERLKAAWGGCRSKL